MISNSAYAKRMRVTPSINRRLLLGIILHGGVYDLRILSSDLISTYIGTDDFADDPRLEKSSVVRNITADFPAMFISVGNEDALASESRPLGRHRNENLVFRSTASFFKMITRHLFHTSANSISK